VAISDLFEPLSLLHGPEMRNRFMLAPLTNQQSERDGCASEYDQQWIEKVAGGGYGLIQTCATTVEASGVAYDGQLGIHNDGHLRGLARMADAIRHGGGLSAVQLHHGGHRARPRFGGVPSPASGATLPGIKALTTEEVERIRDSFIAAARRAELAGFDGVALHGAFGWILSEFMSPLLNDRTDRFGGNVENRARLTVEVIEGIRRACGPDFQVGWRLSVERFGLRLDELREIAADFFERELIDYLDLALWDSLQIVQDGTYKGQSMLSVFTNLRRRGVRVGMAGGVRSAQRAAQVLEDGCDFVLIGRAGIIKADFPLQVMTDPSYEIPHLPVTADYLRTCGLSDRFFDYMCEWPSVVHPESL